MELYRFTCDQARLEGPSPMMLALMAALSGNAADTRRFMGTVATTVAMSEFYAPNNLMRIMRAAAARSRHGNVRRYAARYAMLLSGGGGESC